MSTTRSIKTAPRHPSKWREEFLDHYEVKKTARDAIELSIEDTDRELAALMANTARNKIDEIVQRLIKNTQQKNLITYENTIQDQERNLKILNDSLIALRRRYNIFDLTTQGDLLTTELTSSETQLAQKQAKLNIIQSNQINIRGRRDSIAKLQTQIAGLETMRDTLRKKMVAFNEGSPAINTISKMNFDANESLAQTRERYKQLVNVYSANIPSIILVEEGAVPVVKYRPRRSIIVIAAGFVAFFFSVLGVLVFDAYQGIDWKEVFKPEKG
jgi:tyrosine-protein kinase Etk/Wzc